MIAALKALFADEAAAQPSEHDIQLACAALICEVATIDGNFDQAEQQSLLLSLKQRFALTDIESSQLSELAQHQRHDATSLHQFTRLINEHRNNKQKLELLVDMWRVAYADGSVDKYEEHLIRRVADLLHLGHSAFIQAKQRARKGD